VTEAWWKNRISSKENVELQAGRLTCLTRVSINRIGDIIGDCISHAFVDRRASPSSPKNRKVFRSHVRTFFMPLARIIFRGYESRTATVGMSPILQKSICRPTLPQKPNFFWHPQIDPILRDSPEAIRLHFHPFNQNLFPFRGKESVISWKGKLHSRVLP
jgi:hypothetical protein